MRHYLDHYSVVDYICQYEWQVARHELHRILRSPANDRRTHGALFGSVLSDPVEPFYIYGVFPVERALRRIAENAERGAL